MRTLRDHGHPRDHSKDRRADHDSAPTSFWQFSLAFYAEPGVAAALIALQDREGCDVNLILFALWLGLGGRAPLDAAGLAAAEDAAGALTSAAVEPLRRLRRALKAMPQPDIQRLRTRVAALELAAEKAVQRRLAATAGAGGRGRGSPLDDRLAVAHANLALVLGAGTAARAEADLLRRRLAESARRTRPITRELGGRTSGADRT